MTEEEYEYCAIEHHCLESDFNQGADHFSRSVLMVNIVSLWTCAFAAGDLESANYSCPEYWEEEQEKKRRE